MSVTRLICEGCGFLQMHCNCKLSMTDHPKPIARYMPGLELVDKVATRPIMPEHERGNYVRYADHEVALAAKDARIAELERASDLAIQMQNDRMGELDDLRTAIEAMADERISGLIGAWVEPGTESPDKLRELFLQDLRDLASELRALLEKKP